MNDDSFEGPRLLISHAKAHIHNFELAIQGFFNQQPFAFLVEPNTGPYQYRYKIKITAELPKEWPLFVFDAANALRAALDHSIYASSLLVNRAEPIYTKFPFGDTIRDVESDIKRGCRDVPPAILDFVRGLEPYEAGDISLWALNKLRNRKIHRLLLKPVIAGSTGVNFIPGRQPRAGFGVWSDWDAATNEYTYMVGPAGLHDDVKVNVVIAIRLGEVKGLPDGEAPSVLRDLSSKVKRIVMGIEAETRRIVGE